MRNSVAIQEEMGPRRARPRVREPPSTGVQRSKTLAGRKLRIMTVEKGLLRETKTVQKMIDALLECRVRALSASLALLFDRYRSSTWMTWTTN